MLPKTITLRYWGHAHVTAGHGSNAPSLPPESFKDCSLREG